MQGRWNQGPGGGGVESPLIFWNICLVYFRLCLHHYFSPHRIFRPSYGRTMLCIYLIRVWVSCTGTAENQQLGGGEINF